MAQYKIQMKDAQGNTLMPQTLASLVDGLEDVIAGHASVTELEEIVARLDGEDDLEGSVKKQIKDAIADVVDEAPEAFDTLKEIATWLANDENKTASDLVASTNANAAAIGEKAVEAEGEEGQEGYKPAQAATGIYKDLDDLRDDLDKLEQAAEAAHSAVAETTDTEELKGNPTVVESTNSETGQKTYTIAGGLLYSIIEDVAEEPQE